jgi:hypothetical protein
LATRAAQESKVGKVITGVTGAVTEPSSIGEVVGTSLVPGPLKPFAGAGGAALGEGYRQWQAGEPFDVTKMGKEAMWSLIPEVAESAGRAALKTASRGTSTGKTLMRDEAAQRARQVPETVFEPKPAGEISNAFEAVRRTNVQIDSSDLVTRLQSMPVGKQDALMNDIAWIDSHNRTGGRYTQMLESLRKPGASPNVDIGQLQDLRSQLRKRAGELPEGEAQQLMRDFQNLVDDVIYNAPATGARVPGTRALLGQARQDWARRMAADDMLEMVEDKIRSSQDLSTVSLNLAGLYDQLRRGRTQMAASVDRAIDLMPGGRERFETTMQDVAQQFQYVNLPKVPGLEQALSYMMLNTTLRDALRGAIVQGRGTVSPNTMALLVNAARREMQPQGQQGEIPESARFSLRTSESAQAPGGVARRSD